ncbi:MAG: ComEC/Rec2 family competence protein [Alphaproteobacteria bacterium]|nr:MAG: ComEC/Rec2 family competence protein [Alphaproteobacteria bacterium]
MFHNRLKLEEAYFIPVFFGAGVVSYFSYESFPFLLIAFFICLFGFLTYYFRYFLFLTLLFAGYGWMHIRANYIVDTQFITQPVENIKLKGIVENIELSSRGQRVVIDIEDHDTLKKVRLRVWKSEDLIPGQTIVFRAHLFPFSEKLTPYSFDFKQAAFYQGINASGRILKVIHKSDPQKKWLQRVRQGIKDRILKNMNGPVKNLAVALTIGDKSGIPQKTREAFSKSGLSHILSISGLHLSLIAFFLMFFFRLVFSLFLILHERYPMYKVTPILAWAFLLPYNFISGAGFPVQRAFIMMSLFILGVITDRRTVSLYSVCLAAFCIMLVCPESVMSVSFQLSFGAVLPIIAFYEKNTLPALVKPLVSTIVASIGTLPFSITVFKYITLQAMTGNILALPLFSYIIMPLTMLSFLGIGYYFLEVTLNWLVWIANYVSFLQWSYIPVPATSTPYFLLLFVIGGLWVCLIQNKWRFWGIGLILLSPLFYKPVTAPNVLISPDGMVRAWKVNSNTYYTDNLRGGKFYLDEWEKVYAIRIFRNK